MIANVRLNIYGHQLKFFTGGYVPICIGLLLFAIVLTWHWGRDLVRGAYSAYLTSATPKDMAWLVNAKKRLDKHRAYVEHPRLRRVVELDRAVIFLVSRPITSLSDNTPIIIRIFMKRHGALPKYIVLLTIVQDKYRSLASTNVSELLILAII
jgi:K+ transporter